MGGKAGGCVPVSSFGAADLSVSMLVCIVNQFDRIRVYRFVDIVVHC